MPMPSSPLLASPSSAGWPLSSSRFEACESSRVLRLTSSRHEASTARLLDTAARFATCVIGSSHGDSLQCTREVRLDLTHQSSRSSPRTSRRASTKDSTAKDAKVAKNGVIEQNVPWRPWRPSRLNWFGISLPQCRRTTQRLIESTLRTPRTLRFIPLRFISLRFISLRLISLRLISGI